MKQITVISLMILLLCGVGYAQQRIDPRHPDAVEFPVFGQMVGHIDRTTSRNGIGEQFGYVMSPVGDVNRDGMQDWIVSHNRIDSLYTFNDDPVYGPFYAIELLLYKGVWGGLPSVESGERIGPTELFCDTHFLAAGDFDADGNRDLVILAKFWGDTSYGNDGRKRLSYVIVYWGNQSGSYSNNDTTRLVSTAYTWLAVVTGQGGDITHDRVDDLVLYTGPEAQGWGHTVKAPNMHVFTGLAGQRWGRNGVSAHARMRWSFDRYSNTTLDLTILDHDLDGLNDLAVINQASNISSGESRITMFYGKAGRELPDTLDTERIELTIAKGKSVRLIDITGDGAPELVMPTGSEKTFKVFAGRPGQRLEAQYAFGFNPPIEGQGWWRRPWQVVKQPAAIHDGWSYIEQESNAALGDGNLDGIADIWSYSAPFLLCYTTGEYLDQWVDGYIRIGTLYSTTNLGDIDGSGVHTIALHYDHTPRKPLTPFPGGIVFIKPSRSLPTKHLDPPLMLPHLPPASVEKDLFPAAASDAVGMTLLRDGRSGRYMLGLRNGLPGVQYPVQVVNLRGERVAVVRLSVTESQAGVELPHGLYFVSMRTKSGIFTRSLLVD